MESTKEPDTMSGIEPLESSAATSALLLASPGSVGGKLSISFGSYHSSLQSSPKNPEQFEKRVTLGSQELEQAISPLHPRGSPVPNTHFTTSPNTRTSVNERFTLPTNAAGKTNATSLPATPFTHDHLVDESKHLIASANELAFRDRATQPHQYTDPYRYKQLGDPDSVQSQTKRELFSKPPPVHRSNTAGLPVSSTAYTSASRSYRSYGSTYDDKKNYGPTYEDKSKYGSTYEDKTKYGATYEDKTKYGATYDDKTKYGPTYDDKPTAVSRDAKEKGAINERKTNSSISPRNRSSMQNSNPLLSAGANSRSYQELKTGESYDHRSPAQQEIAEMERVRESLHQMLGSSPRRQESRDGTPTDLLNGLPRPKTADSWDSIKTDTLLSAQPYHDVSPMGVDSGFDLSILRSLASNASRDVAETDGRDATLHTENHILRDSLEKERFRRKHCEKQIAELQSKLLETQQQLAVAISTDKKKDAMIEQLDKTLARLVDGWKKQDTEKVQAIGQLKSQKERAETKLQELQKLYAKQSSEVTAIKETLQDIERQNASATKEQKAQIISLERERSSLTEQLQRDQHKLQDTHKQHEDAVEMWQRLQKELRQTQQSLLQEKEDQHTTEERLQEQMDIIDKENQEALNREKARADDQTQKANEACDLLTAVQRDVDKLKEQLESAIREKENVKLELNLQEARLEAAQRKHEAEWQEDMEKTLQKRLTELQERALHTETDMRESHRGQISNLQEQHQREVDEMRTVHSEENMQREKRLETLRQQYQERLDENQEELSKMNNKMEDVQHEKTLLVGKLQDVLQAYYSGALMSTSSQSATPTQQSQTTSPTPRHDIITRDLFGGAPQRQMRKDLLTTPTRPQLLEKQDRRMDLNKGLRSTTRDTTSRNELSASQIAALHTTVHLQHQHHHHQQQQNSATNTSSYLQTNPANKRLHNHTTGEETLRNSPTALSEHEISHISRATTAHRDSSLVTRDFQFPGDNTRFQKSHNAMQSSVSHNASVTNKTHPSFREDDLLSGAPPIQLQPASFGHAVLGMTNPSRPQGEIFGGDFRSKPHQKKQELVTLEQDPDRSGDLSGVFGESFLYGRGYTSGEFLPLQAVTGSPTGSILSTGPISEGISDLSSAPLHPTKSNVMLLEKLAEHEQRQLALQHYIQMLLQRSPGTSEEVRHTTNKPAIDTSVVMKETLPVTNDNHWRNQRPETDQQVVEHQRPSQQKSVPSGRIVNTHDKHIPAERLQQQPSSKPTINKQQATSARMSSGIAANRQGIKGKSANSLQPASSGRPPVTKSVKSTAQAGRSTTAPTRLSTKGKVSRVAPSRGGEKRSGVTADSTGKKRPSAKGKDIR